MVPKLALVGALLLAIPLTGCVTDRPASAGGDVTQLITDTGRAPWPNGTYSGLWDLTIRYENNNPFDIDKVRSNVWIVPRDGERYETITVGSVETKLLANETKSFNFTVNGERVVTGPGFYSDRFTGGRSGATFYIYPTRDVAEVTFVLSGSHVDWRASGAIMQYLPQR